MIIWLFNFLSRLTPESWKFQIKKILRAIVLDVSGPPASQPAARPHPESLPEFYINQMEKLNPDSDDFPGTLEELKSLRSALKHRYSPKVLRHSLTTEVPEVSIIIPVYSNHELLCSLMRDLDSGSFSQRIEIVLVNDHPQELLPVEMLQKESAFPLTVIQHQWNAGFAGACNTGAQYATGNFLLFLNSDIHPLRHDWLNRMMDTMKESQQTGIVGAKTLYPGGNLIEHFGMYPFYFEGAWRNAHYFHRVGDGVFPETLNDREVEMVTGAAMLVRASLFLECGGFDESFLVGGYEDSDLCLRARKLGYGVRVSAGAVLEHRKSASLKKSTLYTDILARGHERYYNHTWGKELAEQPVVFQKTPHRKRRVLYVVHGHPPEQVGGTEVYNHNLAQAVSALGEYECVILARGQRTAAYSEGAIVHDPGASGAVPVFRCLCSRESFLNVHSGAELEFELFLKSICPDIVHFNHTEHLSTNFVQIAKRCIQGPVLYTLHEFLPICANNGLLLLQDKSLCDGAETVKCAKCVQRTPPEITARERLYRENFSNVDLFIAPSRGLKERYLEWGLPAERIHYSRNGMPMPQKQASARIPGDKTHFVFTGQVAPHKGIFVLMDAVEILSRMTNRFEVHVHGWAPEDFEWRFQRKLGSLKQFVFFHGPYSNHSVQEILQNADTLILPSIWWENCPLTILEAFIAKVPVITSNIGGMKELVEDGEHGLLFEAGNAQDLAARMLSVIENPQQLTQFREHLKKVHVKSIEEQAAELADIYRNLLRNAEIENRERQTV